MIRWALSHEDDEGFGTEKVLTDWAKKRERGAWSGRPSKPSPTRQDLNEKLARLLADYWSQHPEELAAVLDRVEASINGNAGGPQVRRQEQEELHHAAPRCLLSAREGQRFVFLRRGRAFRRG